MSTYFYTDEAGEVQGPYEWEYIVAWVQDGSVPQTTYVQEVNGGEWTLFQDMVGGGGGGAAEAYQELVSQEIGAPADDYWEHSVWHYLDDESVVQGPYTTATIGNWLQAGALDAERYCSVDGSEWLQLFTTDAYLTLWSASMTAIQEESSAHVPLPVASKGRRQSVTNMAAQRSAVRRQSVAAASTTTATVHNSMSASGGRPTNLATKLNSQRSLLRKTTGKSAKKHVSKRPEAPPDTMNALMKGLEVRRTILTRGKKRRSSIVKTNAVFRMADGSSPPDAASSSRTRFHKRRVSDFSEDDEDDDWLSD